MKHYYYVCVMSSLHLCCIFLALPSLVLSCLGLIFCYSFLTFGSILACVYLLVVNLIKLIGDLLITPLPALLRNLLGLAAPLPALLRMVLHQSPDSSKDAALFKFCHSSRGMLL